MSEVPAWPMRSRRSRANVVPTASLSAMDSLPDEVLVMILSHLSPEVLCRATLVSKRWLRAADALPNVWNFTRATNVFAVHAFSKRMATLSREAQQTQVTAGTSPSASPNVCDVASPNVCDVQVQQRMFPRRDAVFASRAARCRLMQKAAELASNASPCQDHADVYVRYLYAVCDTSRPMQVLRHFYVRGGAPYHHLSAWARSRISAIGDDRGDDVTRVALENVMSEDTETCEADRIGKSALFHLYFLNDHERAEVLFKRAIADSESDAVPTPAQTLIRHLYARFLDSIKNDFAAAEPLYAAAIQAEPSNSFYLAFYGGYLMRVHDDAIQALELYKRAAAAGRNEGLVLCNYGLFLADVRGDLAAAGAVLRVAVRSTAGAGNGLVLCAYARFLAATGQSQDAAAFYKAAAAVEPHYEFLASAVASFFASHGRHNEARKYLHRAKKARSYFSRHPVPPGGCAPCACKRVLPRSMSTTSVKPASRVVTCSSPLSSLKQQTSQHGQCQHQTPSPLTNGTSPPPLAPQGMPSSTVFSSHSTVGSLIVTTPASVQSNTTTDTTIDSTQVSVGPQGGTSSAELATTVTVLF